MTGIREIIRGKGRGVSCPDYALLVSIVMLVSIVGVRAVFGDAALRFKSAGMALSCGGGSAGTAMDDCTAGHPWDPALLTGNGNPKNGGGPPSPPPPTPSPVPTP